MRRVVVMLALVGCRPQAGPIAAAPQVAPAPVSAAAVAPAPAAGPPDRDGDTVPDDRDQCPDVPEDLDRFEDEDGCVDRDNDGDRVLDAFEFKAGRWTNCDRMVEDGIALDCRNRPEDYDGFDDLDGCPDTFTAKLCDTRLSEQVSVDGSGKFRASAMQALDSLAAKLRAEPGLTLFVEAHVDARPDPVAARRLTGRIAEAVIAELVRRGIDRQRLEPIGWGHEKPLARNDSAEHRQDNRRVEFNIKSCGRDSLNSSGQVLDCR